MGIAVAAANSAPTLAQPRRNAGLRPPTWLFRDVLLPLLVSRFALTLVGLAASSGNFMATWANWDAGWYASIAQHGYNRLNDINQANTAFAPALPLLMRLASFILGSNASDEAVLVCGFVITNLALFVAMAYLVALV
ncbi:MAG: hypothetical protein JO318_12620 [Chloroflexi bacterium]|nr:hypothetical protein [Chloroflexota bacterium]